MTQKRLTPAGALAEAIRQGMNRRSEERLTSATFGEYADGSGTWFRLAFTHEMTDRHAGEIPQSTDALIEQIVRAFEQEYRTDKYVVHPASGIPGTTARDRDSD